MAGACHDRRLFLPEGVANYILMMDAPVQALDALGRMYEPKVVEAGSNTPSGKLAWMDHTKTLLAVETGLVEIVWRDVNGVEIPGQRRKTYGIANTMRSGQPKRIYHTHLAGNATT